MDNSITIRESSRKSWYQRIWSWNPLFKTDSKEESSRSSSERTFDLNSTMHNDKSHSQSLQRRNAFRQTNKQNQKRGTRKTALFVDDATTKTFSVNIFELYQPWKVDAAKFANFTSSAQHFAHCQPIIQNSITGDYERVKYHLYLASLGKTLDSLSVNCVDEKGRSALHFASAYGHSDIVEILLNHEANPNCLDSTYAITPLICAAVNGNIKTMDLLISKGADLNFGLNNSSLNTEAIDNTAEYHTSLFWAVKAGNVDSVKYLLEKGAALTGTSIDSETPVHEAAYLGNAPILNLLVKQDKAIMELRGGKDKNTALNISVEQGHYECVELLLSSGADPNRENGSGQTPIHLASASNDSEMMKLLLRYGADIYIKDGRKRTAFHHCIHPVSPSNYLQAIECIELLLENDADINAQDENNVTPFHEAVDNGASAVVAILLKNGADLTLNNNAGQSGVELLVKKMPHAIRYVKDSLDYAISIKLKDIADPECSINLDFRSIVVAANNNMDKKKSRKPRREIELLQAFCDLGHKEILAHPVIEAFLYLKWQKVKKYFWASFFANLLLVIIYSYFVVNLYGAICPLKYQKQFMENNNTQNLSQFNYEVERGVIEVTLGFKIIWYILCLMISIFITKEAFQLFSSPKSYFKLVENYAQILFILLTFFAIFPSTLGGPINLNENLCSCLRRGNFIHYMAASVGVAVAWFLVLLRIGKLPKLGLYVQMLFKVVSNFGMFILTYVSIIVAFASSFAILFDEISTFGSIFHSLLSTLIMMTGEVDVKDVISLTQSYQPLSFLTYIVFTAFVLLVTVVLMNLLVGLFVSDLLGLRMGAKVARLSRIVVAISQLESMLFSNPLITIFPRNFVYKLRNSALLLAHNKRKYMFSFRPHDPRDKKIPKSLQEEALQILENQELIRVSNITKNNRDGDCRQIVIEKLDKLEISIANIQQALQALSPTSP